MTDAGQEGNQSEPERNVRLSKSLWAHHVAGVIFSQPAGGQRTISTCICTLGQDSLRGGAAVAVPTGTWKADSMCVNSTPMCSSHRSSPACHDRCQTRSWGLLTLVRCSKGVGGLLWMHGMTVQSRMSCIVSTAVVGAQDRKGFL